MADIAQLERALRNADQAGDTEAAGALAQAIKEQRAGMPTLTKNADLASQGGLTLRAVAKGALAIPAMGADALGGIWNYALDKTVGPGVGPRAVPQIPLVDRLLTRAGIPEPDTPLQRMVGKAVETATGSGAAAQMANVASRGATGVTQQVLQRMAADPTTQTIAGASAGAAGQQSAENGGGWGSQFLSSMLGGAAGAGAVGAVRQGANAVRNAMTPATKSAPADIERTINVTLQRQGIDPASITPAMKQALMKDVADAMKVGENLDPAAMARLADYRRLELTPTRGRLTLDPIDVTREQNAMKMAAATGARDAQLPTIAQQNNQRLLAAIDELKPLPDNFAAGESIIRPIAARDASLKAQIDSLYSQARDTAGRSAQLDGATFTQRVNEALQKNLAPKLGAEVDQVLNDIALGKTPLTVEYAQQLATMLGRKAEAARGTQGDLAHAYGIIRRGLDEAPLVAAPKVNPGNLPAVPGTVPASPAALGRESIDAFNAARGAARERFSWQDSAPGIAKALEGANADTFVQTQILSKSAGLKDVARLAETIGTDPGATQAVRGAIVQHLKDAGIGKGNSAATANFSGRQWLAALDGVGDRKLSLFFSPAELEQLKAIGRVGTIETFQPRGSAVNNSSSAAGMAGLMQGLSNNLGPLLGKIPGGQALGRPALDNITLSYMEKGARNVPAGLLSKIQPPVQSRGLTDPLLLPLLTSGGLFSTINP